MNVYRPVAKPLALPRTIPHFFKEIPPLSSCLNSLKNGPVPPAHSEQTAPSPRSGTTGFVRAKQTLNSFREHGQLEFLVPLRLVKHQSF